MNLEEFLESQSSTSASDSHFTATLEPVPEKPAEIKVTPFREDQGCGCASSFELPKAMIHAVTPTGKFHFCCGKRLEVVVVEFTEHASIPVAELMRRSLRRDDHPHVHGGSPFPPAFAMGGGHGGYGGHGMPPRAALSRSRAGAGIVGRFPIPWTPCTINCIEVCTEFCSDVGWDCCQWETRCAIDCSGYAA